MCRKVHFIVIAQILNKRIHFASVGVVVQCEGEPYVAHASRMEGMAMAGGFVTYVCDPGYTLHPNAAANYDYVNAATVRCGFDGQWHSEEIVCEREFYVRFLAIRAF